MSYNNKELAEGWVLNWLSLPRRLWGIARPTGSLCALLGRDKYRELLALGTQKVLRSRATLPANFSNDDLVAVHWYTHQKLRKLNYKSLNAVLWGQYRAEKKELLELSAHLTVALEKLPPFVGTCWRTAKFDVTGACAHPEGGTTQYPAFTSTSRQPRVPPSPGGTFIKLESRTGRYIGGMSRFPDEEEVLFLPGTTFDVLTNQVVGGIRQILMVES